MTFKHSTVLAVLYNGVHDNNVKHSLKGHPSGQQVAQGGSRAQK